MGKVVKEIYLVTGNQLDSYWELVEDKIQLVIDKQNEECLTTDYVYARCAKGLARLWVIWDDDDVTTAVVTELVETNDHRALRVWLLGGRLEDLTPELYRKMEVWALKTHGCTTVESFARPGLAKHMIDNFGFNKRQVRIVRAIPEVLH